MKNTFLTLFVFAMIISANVYGQDTDSASVDIRAILEKQIAEIRSRQELQTAEDNLKSETITNKETGSKIADAKIGKKQKAEIIPAENLKVVEKTNELIPKSSAVKLFVMVEAIMLAVLFLLWYSKNSKNRKRQIAILKNNIKSLREEKIGSRHETNLSKLRSSLRFQTIKINDNGKDITYRARKNQISKGEIHLAAKIKLMAGDYR